MSISPEKITLTAAQQELLARLAEETGRSWGELLAEALSSLQQASSATEGGHESVFDAMTRLGLLGCIKDGAVDLSSNPKHMEGFGQGDR